MSNVTWCLIATVIIAFLYIIGLGVESFFKIFIGY